MALKMIESFDGESTFAQLVNNVVAFTEPAFTANVGKWGSSNGTAPWTLDAGGRTGACLRKANDTGCLVKSRSLGLGTECFAGFNFRTGAVFPSSAWQMFVLLDEDDAVLFTLTLNTNGSLTITGNQGAAITATSATGVIVVATDYYIEIRFRLADAGGVVEAKLNGGVVATASGDTKGAAATSIERAQFGSPSGIANGTGIEFDDFYICDAGGATNNNYLGDVKVRVIRPDGDGNSSQFVNSASTSVNNYSYVDEQSTNDSDYVESTTDGDKDTYTYENPTILGSVAGVQVVTRSVFTNAGDPKDLNAVARLSGVETEVLMDLNTVLRQNFAIFETKPGGGVWTDTDLDNTEFGYKQVDA